ncbi:Longin-like domain-containing protein [Thamnocephalis sphaerospora]|uniref:Coatomer subunit zeta n=1 Tax=Thamnocephalis sphaerospora TaxID=78915 RepID=A0A4P9XG00_9FUNG|nr:Longin-like domain-containing protein [Thamnocephalis sphaerospora]|eukprot:RKP04526.1 Longin-like domain-containing protein [Thamnocephalis sphaerospora]
MSNLSLYAVKAVLILDADGQRLLAKYYPHATEFAALKDQRAFEKSLFEKTRRTNICYRSVVDVYVYVVGVAEENEIILSTALNAFVDALDILLRQRRLTAVVYVIRHQMEKQSIQSHYDTVVLALDECIDDGVVLEVDEEQIASRVSKRGMDTIDVALTEQTLMQAYQSAKERLANSLLK